MQQDSDSELLGFGNALALLCVIVLLLPMAPAQAANFTVNSYTDAIDLNPGDGECKYGVVPPPLPPRPLCSLRAAIQEANALAGADTITLRTGVYTLTIAGADEGASATGDLDITGSLTILGAGSTSTVIDANNIDRVFDILITSVPNSVSISDLTIKNGNAIISSANPTWVGRSGGGIFFTGQELQLTNVRIISNKAFLGGGIYYGGLVNRTATLTNCVVANNTAIATGGGISVGTEQNKLNLVRSTISGNTAQSEPPVINPAHGGGIFSNGTLFITGSTISNNTAEGVVGGIHDQGPSAILINTTISGNSGLGIAGGQNLQLTNSTISNNSGGGLRAPAVLSNTILSGNTGSDCNSFWTGPIASTGYNLDGDGSCGFTGTGDISNTDPMLGPLMGNGGPTFTHALLTGSPAIDAGDPLSTLTTDQRGLIRPIDGDGDGTQQVDIGAFEEQSVPCTKTGYVSRVAVKPGANDSTIYLRASSLASSYKTFTTQDAKLIKAAVKSLPGRTYVQIKGNADCTTAISGGAAQHVIVAP